MSLAAESESIKFGLAIIFPLMNLADKKVEEKQDKLSQ